MSDSSDSDDFLGYVPFPATKRKRTVVTLTPSPKPPVTLQTPDTSGTAESKMDDAARTEAEAKKKINLAFVPSQVSDPSTLFWRKTSGKKKAKGRATLQWYPCRECHPDEGIGLNIPQKWDNKAKVLVQYIEGTSFDCREIIPRSSLIPFHGDDGGSTAKSSERMAWCPQKIKEMSDRNRKSKKKAFSDESSIRAMELYMEKVLDVSISRMKELKAKAKTASEDLRDLQHLQDEGEEQSPHSTTGSAIISQSQGDNETDECSSTDEYEDCQDRKTQVLRPGDIVEYYQPNQVFGDSRFLGKAEIEAINCSKEMVLKLRGGVFLDRDQKVKRIKVMKRKKLEDFDGQWMRIRDYKLRSATLKTSRETGMKAEAIRLKRVIDEKKQKTVKKLKDEGLEQFTGFLE